MLSRDRIQGKQNKSIKKKNFVGFCRSGTHKRLEELFVLFLCSSRAGITLGVLFFTASTTTTAVVSFLNSPASLYVAAIRRQKVVGMRTWGGFLEDFLFTLAWLRSLTTNIGVSKLQSFSFCLCSWNYALLVVTLMSWWRLLTWEALHDMSVFFFPSWLFFPQRKTENLNSRILVS